MFRESEKEDAARRFMPERDELVAVIERERQEVAEDRRREREER